MVFGSSVISRKLPQMAYSDDINNGRWTLISECLATQQANQADKTDRTRQLVGNLDLSRFTRNPVQLGLGAHRGQELYILWIEIQSRMPPLNLNILCYYYLHYFMISSYSVSKGRLYLHCWPEKCTKNTGSGVGWLAGFMHSQQNNKLKIYLSLNHKCSTNFGFHQNSL